MTLLDIAFAYLRTRLLGTLLNMLLMALGMAMMAMLLLIGHQASERFYRDGAGIDVVVGAKGSPLQLVLSTIWHMDVPTGNIPLAEAEKLQQHPQIKQAIPLSLGDSYRGFRIVGTTPDYLTHFRAKLSEGSVWNTPMQAVLGAQVAHDSGLKTGDVFAGNHGLVAGGHTHENDLYKVTGILEPTGSVLDKLVLTSLESVWDIHASPKSKQPKEITALLVSYQNRAANLSFPRYINQQTSMQAASPAFEIARLTELVGVGTDGLMFFGVFLVGVSLLSVFISLLGAIRERSYDLAILRTLGASRLQVFKLIILEGMLIATAGSAAGLLAGHVVVSLLGTFTAKGAEMGLHGFVFLPSLYWLWAIVLLVSFVACLIPAWEAYKTNIRNTLARHA